MHPINSQLIAAIHIRRELLIYYGKADLRSKAGILLSMNKGTVLSLRVQRGS